MYFVTHLEIYLYLLLLCFCQLEINAIMEYLGLLFEILFLGLGVYVYLFSRGFIKPKTDEAEKATESFRGKKGRWVRVLALALVAVMAVEIILNLRDMFG